MSLLSGHGQLCQSDRSLMMPQKFRPGRVALPDLGAVTLLLGVLAARGFSGSTRHKSVLFQSREAKAVAVEVESFL